MLLDVTAFRNLDEAESHEWVLTNGLGGYASATVTGANTRRYHALLMASLLPPVERVLLVSQVEEELESDGQRYGLATAHYPGVIHPAGYRFLESFALAPLPTWRFRVGSRVLERRVAMPHGQNATIVSYRLRGGGAGRLRLRPLVNLRDYHSDTQGQPDLFTQEPLADGVALHSGLGRPLIIRMVGARYQVAPQWHERMEYPRERERGLTDTEDHFSPGVLEVTLGTRPVNLVCALDGLEGEPEALVAGEEARLRALAQRGGQLGWLPGRLFPAADSFLVDRYERGEGAPGAAGKTIIAGYHWFADWGRDTMIALPGICLVTGRLAEARQVLLTFAGHLRRGLVPNRFSDTGAGADYNTVDASLWFIHAAWKYYQYSRDAETVRALRPALEEILAAYREGTDFGIGMDPEDGLIRAGGPGLQLTWMDAKVGDWVVTPRWGKPVEISALWYNALRAAADLGTTLGWPERGWGETAERVGAGFARFWNPDIGCLYDVLDGPAGADPAVRPNQVLAAGLPFPVLVGERAAAMLEVVRERLLTPFGLRTLDPGHPEYRGQCTGDQRSRDGAYHQGTVWPWLIGPYLDALARTQPGLGRRQVRRLLGGLTRHLREVGLGTISEIFDGDLPHRPRGCVSQAWSVAEVLRVWVEHGKEGT